MADLRDARTAGTMLLVLGTVAMPGSGGPDRDGGSPPPGGAAGARGARPASRASAGPARDTVRVLVERAREAAGAGRYGEAARGFAAAAARDPSTARWLRLSALQAASRAPDTALAARMARALAGDGVVPEDSMRAAEARAYFAAGDTGRGTRAAEGLAGAAAPGLWAEHLGPALLARGDTARARAGLASAATAEGAPAGPAELLLEIGASWDALAAAGRADLREGRGARGRRLLARAIERAPGPSRPALALELAEARIEAGRAGEGHGTATEWLSGRELDPTVRARLELAAARSHFRRGQRRQGVVHLRRSASAGAGEPSARAAYLLADLAHDADDGATARERYRRVVRDFPRTRHGGIARMRLGFLALSGGQPARAARYFREYREARPDGGWHTASLYWEARARERAGAPDRAEALLRRVRDRDPVSYYGMLAAGRGDGARWLAFLEGGGEPARRGAGRGSPSAGARSGPAGAPGPEGDARAPAALEELLHRMERLRALDWRERALRELEASRRRVRAAAGGPLPLARRLHAAGWSGPGIGLGWQAFDEAGGRWSEHLLRAVFPFPYRGEIEAAARERGLSPALVAGVARQESAFDPGAVSPAGAVGLLQLMPATARQLAREEGRAPPDPADLRDPGVNLALGTRYLAAMLERFDGSRPAALIAYNAGPHRYERWRRYPEFRSARELMVERIPFAETRRYVKTVLRNEALYGRLYGSSPE